ncbi:Octaprenyl diphosphate synthase [Thermoflexales bacterium]|nr:Octaprenyl diphosphate synthase [Thermoflexales bacterium]
MAGSGYRERLMRDDDVLPRGIFQPMDLHLTQEQAFSLIRDVVTEVEWPDLEGATAQTISGSLSEPSPSLLSFLPSLTYLAAGGEGPAAVPITASWLLYRLAAKVLDDVVDDDAAEDAPWGKWPKGRAMNVGIGLMFLAQSCLSRMQASAVTQREIQETISQTLAFMTRGQAQPPTQPNLEDYMRYIYLKSGVFLGTFAWAGACIHTRSRRVTRALFDFGSALGTLIQINDDLTDLVGPKALTDWSSGIYTLPVIYALGHVEHPKHPQLSKSLEAYRAGESTLLRDILEIFDDMGVPTQCVQLAQLYLREAEHALHIFSGAQVEPLQQVLSEYSA